MIPEPALRWIVTVAFAATGVFCLYRCLRHGSATHRVSDVLHVLMCAGMIAMAWPAGMTFARVPQVLLFSAAAVWFVGVLVLGHAGAHGRLSLGQHALMMGGMAWMVLVMPSAMAGTTMTAASGEHAAMSGGGSSSPGVAAAAVVLAGVFLVAGTAWLARAIDSGRAEHRLRLGIAGHAAEAVMSLGMALMAGLLV
ncbi:hypothetical protein FHX82_005082 [Amycolatopsis bartoniae]|uniref:DUF5134 domain-containing protein n=1 Tax=Amycolatopsis bartoniae TaxID=941986 RepID=A0A8H9IPZ7_9PSEU|nr:DUF5134 domain-containing protein [Amycolatopsis bartoniae]MBB2938006.1 hypothetical protein [Amycolatopsis bartoniae]TVT07576.1 DUF5134 domain-containing protein [Amycolatopsis bartoniae]GHF42270.1 DUF5134 domain-containing protein [Amycolatopsis bartoniae]